MNGRKSKLIRRRAIQTGENYKKLKRTYLRLRRTHGLGVSTSTTPNVASQNKLVKFLGFRKNQPTYNAERQLRPNFGWELHGAKSPMHRAHLKAQGRWEDRKAKIKPSVFSGASS